MTYKEQASILWTWHKCLIKTPEKVHAFLLHYPLSRETTTLVATILRYHINILRANYEARCYRPQAAKHLLVTRFTNKVNLNPKDNTKPLRLRANVVVFVIVKFNPQLDLWGLSPVLNMILLY
jgi:hypothetical protein